MLESFVDSLYASNGMNATVLGVIALALGLLECFAGYRIFRIQVGIVGFLLGLLAGMAAVQSVTEMGWIAIVAGVAAGVILCVVSMKIYKAGVFFLVFFFAYIVALVLVQNAVVALVVAVVVGVVGVFLTSHVLIIVTALGGAGIVADAATRLFPQAGALGWLGPVIMLALGICGIALQYRSKPRVEA